MDVERSLSMKWKTSSVRKLWVSFYPELETIVFLASASFTLIYFMASLLSSNTTCRTFGPCIRYLSVANYAALTLYAIYSAGWLFDCKLPFSSLISMFISLRTGYNLHNSPAYSNQDRAGRWEISCWTNWVHRCLSLCCSLWLHGSIKFWNNVLLRSGTQLILSLMLISCKSFVHTLHLSMHLGTFKGYLCWAELNESILNCDIRWLSIK